MINLIYIIILAFFIFLVYISGKNNRTNLWCVCAGLLLSLGILKELFYYNIVPYLQAQDLISARAADDIYSVMTWMLYDFAMAACVVFAMNFAGLPQHRPRVYYGFQIGSAFCILLLSLRFPPLEFRIHQTEDPSFWYFLSTYNLILGAVFTFLFIGAILKEQDHTAKKQKILVSIIILPPLMYWLATIFIVHPLMLTRYFKLWQGNVLILFICVILYLYIASKEGLMGLKLNIENFTWDSGNEFVNRNAELTVHMLKNYTVKLNWCISNLKQHVLKDSGDLPPEFEIMERSLLGIQNYCDRVKKYSQQLTLVESWVSPDSLYPFYSSDSVLDGNTLTCHLNPEILLYCDPLLLHEIFHNLIANAVDALRISENKGEIYITDYIDSRRKKYLITIRDTGIGMDKEHLRHIFEPYYTTKATETNFGLGLPYCMKIMEKHAGSIEVKSTPHAGSSFTLSFPAKRIRKREAVSDENL